MIDILMATYNGEKYIAAQIESILNQTYTEWKLYIHDDGSKDNTIRVIKSFTDERIILVDDGLKFGNSTKNFMHLAINYSKSEYFCFSDQDDVWLPNKLEITLQELKKLEDGNINIPVCVGTDLKVVDTDLNIMSESFYDFSKILCNSDFHSLMLENVFTGCTMMMNKKVLEYLGKAWDISDKIIQHDWLISLICSSDGKTKQVRIPTMLYRQHFDNVVGAKKFSLSRFLRIKNIIKTWKRLKELKLLIKLQLNAVYDILENEENRYTVQEYLNTKSLIHKKIILKNKLNRSSVISKSLVKFIFY